MGPARGKGLCRRPDGRGLAARGPIEAAAKAGGFLDPRPLQRVFLGNAADFVFVLFVFPRLHDADDALHHLVDVLIRGIEGDGRQADDVGEAEVGQDVYKRQGENRLLRGKNA